MKLLEKFENAIVLSFLASMAIILATQIVMRYIVNKPLIWSEELARYLFVWVAFIGASYGVRKKTHIRMEVIFNKFPKKMQKYVQISINSISMICFIYLIPVGIQFAKQQHQVVSSAMSIPMSYIFMALPIGCILTSFRLMIESINMFKCENE